MPPTVPRETTDDPEQYPAYERDVKPGDHEYVERSAVAKYVGCFLIEEVLIAEHRSDHHTRRLRGKSHAELVDEPLPLFVDEIERRWEPGPIDHLDEERALHRAGCVDAQLVEQRSTRCYAKVAVLIFPHEIACGTNQSSGGQ